MAASGFERAVFAPDRPPRLRRRDRPGDAPPQEAQAVVAARRTLVAGAVGLVDMALREIQRQGVVELDEGRKAAMVSNLMVVPSGDRGPTPIVNTGS